MTQLQTLAAQKVVEMYNKNYAQMLRKLAKRSCVALLLRTGGAQLCGPVGQTGGCCHSVGFGSVGYLRYPSRRIARAW